MSIKIIAGQYLMPGETHNEVEINAIAAPSPIPFSVAMPDDLMEVVHGLSDEWGTVFLFGHNPGFTVFANRFAEGFRFDNVPTCGIVRILSEASSWQDVTPGQARVDSWYFPKEYRI